MKTIHNSSTKEEIIEKDTNAKDGRIDPLARRLQPRLKNARRWISRA